MSTRDALKPALRRLGLMPAAKRAARAVHLYRSYRAERIYEGRFRDFAARHGAVLRAPLLEPPASAAPVALVTSVHFPEVEIELALLKALELAGFRPVLLLLRDQWILRKYYGLAGLEVHSWDDFVATPDRAAAEEALGHYATTQGLFSLHYAGARVGTCAVSTAMRMLRQGNFDLSTPKDREVLVEYVAQSMAYADAAHRILDRFRPKLGVFIDKGYSPKGELFDNALARGVDCVSWDLAHKNSTLMLKRFNARNQDTSTDSISEDSWEAMRTLPLGEAERQRIEQELYGCYVSGDWYSVAGTQFNKRMQGAEELRARLGLDPGKKNAFVFPHVSWDATLFWGGSLYPDYDEWLVETVRAAAGNDRVNWIVKIHPAHIGKAVREGFRGEPAEAVTLRERVGPLPPHVKVIPAESDISTYSLFPLMDWCITVRGRVGIEAARLGIPVLTSGRGPYDRRGFSVDSHTRAEYLARLARIDEIPRLSPEQRALAERFAFGFLFMRPLPLQSASLVYHESHEKSASQGHIHVSSPDGWRTAPDIRSLAEWLRDPSREDYLAPAPEPEAMPAARVAGRAGA